QLERSSTLKKPGGSFMNRSKPAASPSLRRASAEAIEVDEGEEKNETSTPSECRARVRRESDGGCSGSRCAHHQDPDQRQRKTDLRRLLVAGCRAVREDRRQGVRRGQPQRLEELADRRYRPRTAQFRRQRRVLVRLL